MRPERLPRTRTFLRGSRPGADVTHGPSPAEEGVRRSRRAGHEHPTRTTTAKPQLLAVSATFHCLTGCAIGEIVGMMIATAFGWGNVAQIAPRSAGVRLRLRADIGAPVQGGAGLGVIVIDRARSGHGLDHDHGDRRTPSSPSRRDGRRITTRSSTGGRGFVVAFRSLVGEPSHDRRAPATRGSVPQRPLEPNPPPPRSLSSSSLDLDRLGLRERRDHELGDAVARLDLEGLVAVGVEQQHADLAAVAGVDQAGRVDERDPVATARPERGSTRPAWPPGSRSRSRSRRWRAPRRRSSPARQRGGRGRRRRRGRGLEAAPRRSRRATEAASRPSAQTHAAPSAPGLAAVDRELGEAVNQRRGDLARTSTPSAVLLALEVAGELVQLGEAAARRVGDQQLDVGRSVSSNARSMRSRSSSSPSPVSAEIAIASRIADEQVAALLLVEQVDLVVDDQPRVLAGADLLEHRVDRGHATRARREGLGGVDHVQDQVGAIVSSSVALNASTS